jgi:hypothetical protein
MTLREQIIIEKIESILLHVTQVTQKEVHSIASEISKLFSQWISIGEPPKDAKPILIYTEEREFPEDDRIVKGWYENGEYYSSEMHEDEILKPLFYQLLPQAPER